MSEGPWITVRSDEWAGDRKIHLDQNCRHLALAGEVRPIDASELGEYGVCKSCDGGIAQSGWDHYRAARRAGRDA